MTHTAEGCSTRHFTEIHNHYCYIIKTTLFCTFKEALNTTWSYLNLVTLMSTCLVCVFNTGYDTQTAKWKYNIKIKSIDILMQLQMYIFRTVIIICTERNISLKA